MKRVLAFVTLLFLVLCVLLSTHAQDSQVYHQLHATGPFAGQCIEQSFSIPPESFMGWILGPCPVAEFPTMTMTPEGPQVTSVFPIHTSFPPDVNPTTESATPTETVTSTATTTATNTSPETITVTPSPGATLPAQTAMPTPSGTELPTIAPTTTPFPLMQARDYTSVVTVWPVPDGTEFFWEVSEDGITWFPVQSQGQTVITDSIIVPMFNEILMAEELVLTTQLIINSQYAELHFRALSASTGQPIGQWVSVQ